MACDRQALTAPQEPYSVTLEQAQQVAEHLTNTNVSPNAAKLKTVSGHFVLAAGKQPALYVFNYQEGGFCIISADRHLLPVLAYSTTSTYTNQNKPGGLRLWERKIAQTIVDAHATTTPAPNTVIQGEWRAALNPVHLTRQSQTTSSSATGPITNLPAPDPDPTPTFTQSIIGPLLPVTWGQGCTFNEWCPAGIYCNGYAPTGCVMTAMAQIMAYWRYPTNTYAWASMPTNQGNAEVQRLMRYIGVSLPSANYQAAETSAHLEDAAANNHGFRNPSFGYQGAHYTSYNYGTVARNITDLHPVILDGCNNSNSTDCHAWVCDGNELDCYTFDQPQNGQTGVCYGYLHMNWGWHETYNTAGSAAGGDYNGWYQYDNWNVPGMNVNYEYANDMVEDIHP